MSDDIDEAKVSAAPEMSEAATFLYDYFKHLTSLSVLTLGGVLSISSTGGEAAASRSMMIWVIALVGSAALLAFSGTSEIVRQKVTGDVKSKTLTFYRVGAPVALSLGVGAFIYIFLKGLPA